MSEQDTSTTPKITKAEAIEVVTQAAWSDYGNYRDAHEACCQMAADAAVGAEVREAASLIVDHIERHAARRMVHMRTGFGCDVQLDYAIERIEAADSAAWMRGIFGPALAFDGEKPFLIDDLPKALVPEAVKS